MSASDILDALSGRQRSESLGDRAAHAADLLASFEAWRDVVPPLYGAEAALIDTQPIVLDEAQYARAVALGLAGRVGCLEYDAVIFGAGDRFKFARNCDDQRGAEVAYVFLAEDWRGNFVDVVAWVPETGRAALLFGQVGTLGLAAIHEPRLAPPMVYETIADWLLAAEQGLFIINGPRAAVELEGATVAVIDVAAGRRLEAQLKRFTRHLPDIRVPRIRERCFG